MALPKLGVKKGDRVRILSGKDKGKEGKILEVILKKGKVVVEGINVVKRHTKPSREARLGGIMEKASLTFASTVMLVCPRCGKPTKVYRVIEEGKRVRRCKRCKETIDKVK